MNAAVRDCLVTGYEDLIESLALPDPDDRHVLAAAIRADAEVIVTFNLKDFPAGVLAGYNIEAQHPDDFLLALFDAVPGPVCAAVKRQREGLRTRQKQPRSCSPLLKAKGWYRQLPDCGSSSSCCKEEFAALTGRWEVADAPPAEAQQELAAPHPH
jgi:hypothetical protein